MFYEDCKTAMFKHSLESLASEPPNTEWSIVKGFICFRIVQVKICTY